MIPRAASEVFAHIAADAVNEYTVFMSYIQIYMEMIQVHCKAAIVQSHLATCGQLASENMCKS